MTSDCAPTLARSLRSRIDWLASLEADKRSQILATLTKAEARALSEVLHAWQPPLGTARPEQMEPTGSWFIVLYQCGRGWGKTRTAAEIVRDRIDRGVWRTVNVAGPTWTDVFDTMVTGSESAPGLLGVWPPHQRPTLKRGGDDPHLICWNGAKIRLRAAHSAERFRGPQADGGWADEIDSWKPDAMTPEEAWRLFELGIRLGPDPRIIATSTPKRSGLVAKLRAQKNCVVVRGSTLDNRANLAAQFIDSVVGGLEGTRLYRQEVLGEVLEDVAGAIVTLAMIDAHRVAEAPELARIVVGIDPAVTAGEDADETGIIVVGKGIDGHGYVLDDLSCRMSPDGWARRAIEAFERHGADLIVAEKNNGGDMVELTLRSVSRTVPIRTVTATRGKHVRFEPVGALYEQGRIHHVGTFSALEDQITAFTTAGYEGTGSPDRGDAAVWSLSELLVRGEATWSDLYGRSLN